MTAFLQRLVARAGLGGGGEAPPVPAGGVRPRVAGRFEPATAGPPPDQAHEAHEPVGAPAPGPGPGPTWREPGAVHRGVLVTPTGAVPPPPAPPRGVEEQAPGPPPSPVARAGSRRGPGEGPARRRPEPAAPVPAIAPPLPPPLAAGATVDRPPPPPPAPVPGPARARDRRDGGEPSRLRLGPQPVPVQPARPATPPSGARPRARAVGPDRSTVGEAVVHVTIGRVEIRTAPPRPDGTGPRRAAAEPSAATALEDYLAGRAGGRS